MGGQKKETCHRPHGVLINITLEGEPKKWSLFMKETLPPPFKIGPETPKKLIWADFLHFRNRWSGTHTIRFSTSSPTGKL